MKPGYFSSSFGFAGACLATIYFVVQEPAEDPWTGAMRAVACCALSYLGGKYARSRVEATEAKLSAGAPSSEVSE